MLVGRNHFSFLMQILHSIRVTHPNLRIFRNLVIEILVADRSESSCTIFPLIALFHGAPKFDIKKLHPVANSKNGYSKGLQFLKIDIRSIRLAGALRATRKNDCSRPTNFSDIFRGIKLSEKAQFANSANDELGVLRAKIENSNMLNLLHLKN